LGARIAFLFVFYNFCSLLGQADVHWGYRHKKQLPNSFEATSHEDVDVDDDDDNDDDVDSVISAYCKLKLELKEAKQSKGK